MKDYVSSGIEVVHVQPGAEAAAWAEVRSICGDRLSEWGVSCLREGLDGHVRSIVVEPHYICKDYRNLYGRFYSKKFLGRPSWCNRLHFFAGDEVSISQIVYDPDECRGDYLGYSVIQPISERCLGRTVVDPFRIGKSLGEFWCLRTPVKSHINGAEYHVQGYPYFSQSGEAMVCAHAALWGVCRYLSERYSIYSQMLPYDLIERANASQGRRVPYHGMTFSDYSEILSSFGCHPELIRPNTDQMDWRQDRDSFYDLYSYVESGFPVLVSFKRHVATLIGHTSRKDVGKHKPEEGTTFYNSFALMKQYVVVDDNYFPYRMLGYEYDPDNYGIQSWPIISISVHRPYFCGGRASAGEGLSDSAKGKAVRLCILGEK